jgi:copper resistance protein C
MKPYATWRVVRRLAIALLCAAVLMLVCSSGRVAQAHALPVRYTPAQNAVLRSSPMQVQIVFNEHVNPDISVVVVVNPSNQQVDNRDSQVSADASSMTVSLPLLPAGTYVVFWRPTRPMMAMSRQAPTCSTSREPMVPCRPSRASSPPATFPVEQGYLRSTA